METQEDEFDAIIAEELEALDLNDLNGYDDVIENHSLEKCEIDFDDSFSAYFSLIRVHEETARCRVEEAQSLINSVDNVKSNKDTLLLEKLLQTLDETHSDQVMLIRNQVMKDLEHEESEDREEKIKERSDVPENQLQSAFDDYSVEDIFLQEEEAKRKLDELKKSQAKIKEDNRKLYEKKREERRIADNELKQRIEEKQKQVEILEAQFNKQQKVIMETLTEELKQTEQHLIKIREHEEATLNNNLAVEKSRLQSLQNEQEVIKLLKMNKAAVIIQKHFRRYSIQKLFKDQLLKMKSDRLLKEQAKRALLSKQQERRKIREDAKKADDKLKQEEQNRKEKKEKLLKRQKFHKSSVMVCLNEQEKQDENSLLIVPANNSLVSDSVVNRTDLITDMNIRSSPDGVGGTLTEILPCDSSIPRDTDNLNEQTSQNRRSVDGSYIQSITTLNTSEAASEDMNGAIDIVDKENAVEISSPLQATISVAYQLTVDTAKQFDIANCEKAEAATIDAIETVGNKESISSDETCTQLKNSVRSECKDVVDEKTQYEPSESDRLTPSNKEKTQYEPSESDMLTPSDKEKTQYKLSESDRLTPSNKESDEFNNDVESRKENVLNAEGKYEDDDKESDVGSIDQEISSSTLVVGPMSNRNAIGASVATVKKNFHCNLEIDQSDIVEHNNEDNFEALCNVDNVLNVPNSDKDLHSNVLLDDEINNPSEVVINIENKVHQVEDVFQLNPNVDEAVYSDRKRLYQLWSESCQKSNGKLQLAEQNEVISNLQAENVMLYQNQNSLEIFKQVGSMQALVLLNCSVKSFEYTSGQLIFLCLKSCEISSFASASKSLTILDVSNNQLTSLFTFKELRSLIFLNVSHNNISSISGLKNCTQLKYLNIDGNQIVSMKGLKNLRFLNVLSCNGNHIMLIDELSDCSLLVELLAAGNSLSKIPILENNVLLQTLVLDNNNISLCDELSSYWLPSLKELSVADNRIQRIPCLHNVPYLQTLNVENNLLSETSLFRSLTACINLSTIYMKGNPVAAVSNCSQSLNEFLPWLDNDDGFTYTQSKQVDCSFTMFKQLWEPVECLMKDIIIDYSLFESYSKSEIAKNIQNQHSLWDKLQDVLLVIKEKHLFAASNDGSLEAGLHQKRDKPNTTGTSLKSDGCLATTNNYSSLEQSNIYNVEYDANVRESAAVKIQAVYRGFKVRQVYLSLKLSSDWESRSLANSDDSEFNYEEQIDLSSFQVDDGLVEWSVPNTPCIPESFPTLPPIQRSNIHIDHEVKNAWGTPSSSRASGDMTLSAHLLEVSPDGSVADKTESTITERSFASKKAEEIGNEWGFNNLSTAELMLKRAKKMRAGKKKTQLNSAEQRYLNFKKASESCSTVVAHQRKRSQRRNYFQDNHTEPNTNMMTYSWVCNQTVFHQDRADDIFGSEKCKHRPIRQSSEPVILPQLSEAVLSGRPPSLVQSEVVLPKPPVKDRPSSSSSNSAYHRNISKSPKAHSAPSPNERTDPRIYQVDKKISDKWKQYAYR